MNTEPNQPQTTNSCLSSESPIAHETDQPSLQDLELSTNEASSLSSSPSNKKTALDFLSFKKPVFNIVRNCIPRKMSETICENSKIMINHNRKEKSLGELSKKFLMMFGRVEKCVISLETVTQELGVERRRIYDIINILESLGVVFRKGKNNYQWNGLSSINQTILRIEKEISSSKYSKTISTDDDLSDDEEDSQNGKSSKKEKSLGLLSNGYIKLFLTWKNIISLEQAAKKLSSENIEENKIKTKVRRLYDIANVFTALGLIKKTCLEDSRKPAFQWIGLAGLERFIKRLHASQDEREIFEEKFSREVEPIFNSDEKCKLKKSNSMSIQSEQSAFKVRESPSPSHGQQVMLENLLCLLMDLCKQELQMTEKAPVEQKTANNQFKSAEKVNSFSDARNFVTPVIRKSVSIIQSAENTNEITPSKKIESGLRERVALGDLTNVLKRPAAFKLDDCEVRTAKKGNLFNKENKGFEQYSVKKSLEFKGKENGFEENNKRSMLAI
jgi:transcription factor E2F7/8